MLRVADIRTAAERIQGRVRRTPVLTLPPGDLGPYRLQLKLEYLQHTGSFKARGAFNRILCAIESGNMPEAGVLVASGGNAGLAVAYAAGSLGIPAEVYLPLVAPESKVTRLRALGASVMQVGGEYSEAYEAAMRRQQETEALYCHAYDQPEIVAGQGTLGLELIDDIADLDTVLVAVGGGGLVSGIATALGDRVSVVGVEPDTAATLSSALAVGEPVDVEVGGVAADSLGARRIGSIAFDVATTVGIRSVLVPDEELPRARQLLWGSCRIVVEHGTAAALAAITSGVYEPFASETVCVVLCGANTNPADLSTPSPASS